jgi:N-acetylglucosaminyl-diphospho-decaprenol L-rhamnosyltransferase
VSTANGGALVAPQLLNTDGSEQANARGYPYLVDKVANRSLRLPGSSLHDYARIGLHGPTYVAWVMGAAVGGPSSIFTMLGGWDDDFFIYYEDHDLPLRAWLSGVPTVVDPSVRWTHEWQRSTKQLRLRPWMHEVRSMRRFYGKYPELLTRRRMSGSGRWASLSAKLWTKAEGHG